MVDNDLPKLIIEQGDNPPTAEELKLLWEDIVFQYNDALTDVSQGQMKTLYRQYYEAKVKHDLILKYIELLNNWYVEKWAKELNRLLGTRFVFDPSQKEDYDKLLDRCFNRSKGQMLQVELLHSQLDALTKKMNTGDKPTRDYFYGLLISLSDHAEYQITDQVMTWEVCERMNRLQKYIKQTVKK
jgi:hypothetical protein